ncbi:hypothetical protein [Kistimonas asteriae]|uniref:hypothetical protein n=1 Tax=Kistimonas asteriae TaxID=517724 RepID=UPI001BAD76E8|nr:hypothetical protein [Kistimonas asteriae]
MESKEKSLEERLSHIEHELNQSKSLTKQARSLPNIIALIALSLTLFQFFGGMIEARIDEKKWTAERLQIDISSLHSDVSFYLSSRNKTSSDAMNINNKLLKLEDKIPKNPGNIELTSAVGLAYKAIGNIDKAKLYLNKAISLSVSRKDYDRATYLTNERLTLSIWAYKNNPSDLTEQMSKAQDLLSHLSEPKKRQFKEGVILQANFNVCLMTKDLFCLERNLKELLVLDYFDANLTYNTIKSIRMNFGENIGDNNQTLLELIEKDFSKKTGFKTNSKLTELVHYIDLMN